jgi:hypothetical protein
VPLILVVPLVWGSGLLKIGALRVHTARVLVLRIPLIRVSMLRITPTLIGIFIVGKVLTLVSISTIGIALVLGLRVPSLVLRDPLIRVSLVLNAPRLWLLLLWWWRCRGSLIVIGSLLVVWDC